MNSSSKAHKYCLVQGCESNSNQSPSKVFISLPKPSNAKSKYKRNLWLNVIGRDENDISNNARAFVCEDHFNLKEDMVNYFKFRLMGGNAALKADVVPHIFKDGTGRKMISKHKEPEIPGKRRKPMRSHLTDSSSKKARESSEQSKQTDMLQQNINAKVKAFSLDFKHKELSRNTEIKKLPENISIVEGSKSSGIVESPNITLHRFNNLVSLTNEVNNMIFKSQIAEEQIRKINEKPDSGIEANVAENITKMEGSIKDIKSILVSSLMMSEKDYVLQAKDYSPKNFVALKKENQALKKEVNKLKATIAELERNIKPMNQSFVPTSSSLVSSPQTIIFNPSNKPTILFVTSDNDKDNLK